MAHYWKTVQIVQLTLLTYFIWKDFAPDDVQFQSTTGNFSQVVEKWLCESLIQQYLSFGAKIML